MQNDAAAADAADASAGRVGAAPAVPEGGPEGDGAWPPENEGWPRWAGRFLSEYALLPNKTRAAERSGVHRVTVNRLAQRDEAFAVAVMEAHDRALDLAEEVVFAASTSGLTVTRKRTYRKVDGDGKVVFEVTEESTDLVRDPRLAIKYLQRYRREWRESVHMEQTGAGGGPIKHQHDVAADVVLAEFRAELERMGASDREADGAP